MIGRYVCPPQLNKNELVNQIIEIMKAKTTT